MSYKTQPEEKVKLAGDDSKDRLYEPKQNQKLIRIFTVVAYVFCVSLAAIVLSLYYLFIWVPDPKYPAKYECPGSSDSKIKNTPPQVMEAMTNTS